MADPNPTTSTASTTTLTTTTTAAPYASATAYFHRTTDETGVSRVTQPRVRVVEQEDNPGNYNYVGPGFVGPTFTGPPGMAAAYNTPPPPPPAPVAPGFGQYPPGAYFGPALLTGIIVRKSDAKCPNSTMNPLLGQLPQPQYSQPRPATPTFQGVPAYATGSFTGKPSTSGAGMLN